MAKKKQVRNMVILETADGGQQERGIKLVDGARPYLWVGLLWARSRTVAKGMKEFCQQGYGETK